MSQRLGYARVFPGDACINVERETLLNAGCSLLFEESATEQQAKRPQLERCLLTSRSGDTLVVWRLDRIGRSLQDLVKIMSQVLARGVHFESLCESLCIKANDDNQHVFSVLSELDRQLVRERTYAGLAAARACGRRGGRPKKLDDKQVSTIRNLLKNPGTCVAELAREYGVSRTTIYKHCGGIR